jgi:hypothetical protein
METTNNEIKIMSPFGAEITFALNSATEGWASGENLLVNGIMHSRVNGHFGLKPGMKDHENPKYAASYVTTNSSFGFTMKRADSNGYNDATPNARGKVQDWIFAEALKLFQNTDVAAAGHAAKIAGLRNRAAGKVEDAKKALTAALAELAEYEQMTKTQAAFCLAESSHGYREDCLRPVKHSGDHRTQR